MKRSNEAIEGNVINSKGKAVKLKKTNLFVLKDKEGAEHTIAVGQREDMTDLVNEIKAMHKYFTSRNAKILEGNKMIDDIF